MSHDCRAAIAATLVTESPSASLGALRNVKGVAMKKCALRVSLAALSALAAFVAPAQAADGLVVDRFPVSFSFFNPCTDENVDVSGSALAVIDTTPDNHGLSGHSVDIALKGVGLTTGAHYVSVGTNTITENTSDNGARVETVTTHLRLVTSGPGNDLLFAIVFHETINANGDLVILFNRFIPGVCV
jgi:hypothetical protein